MRSADTPLPARTLIGAGSLRVVVVCDHASVTGGLAKVAHESARALQREGHHVTFFAAVPPVDPILEAEGIEVICLNQPDMLGDASKLAAAGRSIWNVEAGRRLSALLATLDPHRTIVHLHGWSKALSPSVIRVTRDSGLSAVATLHDYVSLCPNGALYNYVKEQNCTLRPMSLPCIVSRCDARQYTHKAWRVVRHAVLEMTSGSTAIRDVIYMSELQGEIVAQLLPPGIRLHHVPNPVEADNDLPADVAANDSFMFIGRLSKEKGCVLLARTAHRLGIRAVFVGDGPARSDVIAAMPGATITGWLGTPDVAAQLRSARALVFPSMWYETFGLAVYEALAAGVPVVVSDNTVSARAIEHGVNGLIFRSGDSVDLARQLSALRDPDVAAQIGLTAYQRYWSAPLTSRLHTKRLIDVYRGILAT